MTFISDIYIWRLYLRLQPIFDISIWHWYMTFISGMWFHTFSTTVFKTVVKNVLNTYFTTVFKTVVKMYWIAKPFILPLQIFPSITNKITFSQNSNETRRNWGILPAPEFANSGKRKLWFPYVNSKVYWFTQGSPNPLFYRCNFFRSFKTVHFFKQVILRNTSPL